MGDPKLLTEFPLPHCMDFFYGHRRLETTLCEAHGLPCRPYVCAPIPRQGSPQWKFTAAVIMSTTATRQMAHSETPTLREVMTQQTGLASMEIHSNRHPVHDRHEAHGTPRDADTPRSHDSKAPHVHVSLHICRRSRGGTCDRDMHDGHRDMQGLLCHWRCAWWRRRWRRRCASLPHPPLLCIACPDRSV